MNKEKFTLITVLVHHNSPEECIQLVEQLEEIKELNHKVIVVDNKSEVDSFEKLKNELSSFKCDLIQNSCNGGYGSGMNLGVKHGQKYQPDYIQIINTDVAIHNPNYLKSIIQLFETDKNIGVVGPCVFYKDKSIQNTILPQVSLKSTIFFNKSIKQKSFKEEPPKLYPVEVINGVCMIIRNSTFNSVKGFDEDFFMYGEENDICYRTIKAGYSVNFWSGESIIHFEEHNKTTIKEIGWRDMLVRANQILFLQKHNLILAPFISSLFSFSLIIKALTGYQFNFLPLRKFVFYLFKPLLLNKLIRSKMSVSSSTLNKDKQ